MNKSYTFEELNKMMPFQIQICRKWYVMQHPHKSDEVILSLDFHSVDELPDLIDNVKYKSEAFTNILGGRWDVVDEMKGVITLSIEKKIIKKATRGWLDII